MILSRFAPALAALVLGPALLACGSDSVQNQTYGQPPDASGFDPGKGGSGGGYYGEGGTGGGDGGMGIVEAGPPMCADSLKLCAETFTYPFGGEQSVELRGDYRSGAWTMGDAMTRSGSKWTVTVSVPWNQPVQYKFFINGTTWVADPANPAPVGNPKDTDGNSIDPPITCPASYTCSSPPVPPPGVFDWRDAVIYFAFVDRFLDGDGSNNCNVSGSSSTSTSSANYLGGDWAGITKKINAGYFTDLGVNTIWLTVPLKNADDSSQSGYTCNGTCSTDGHEYSSYHGYWPSDPTQTESCFGSPADLTALVQAAHAKNLKVLFDYAMVHLDTESTVFKNNPSWFTPFCQCGDTSGGCGNYDNYTCWFTPYLAHFDFTNSSAARTFSVGSAIQLVKTYGNDAFRLDAIKQVDPSWLAALRPQIASQILATETPPQRFYMVGETYDFQNRGLIASLIDSTSKLDGQFDFPLRIRLIEAVLMRSTQNMLTPDDLSWSRNAPPGMTGLAQFMDSNDTFYPSDAVMSTFIGNHDLPRSIHYGEQTLPGWLGSSSSDGKGSAWSGQPGVETDPNVYERMANAFAVLLTNKGAPLIYYGDEIGLPGAGDPDNRRMMQWGSYNAGQTALYARIKALTAIRAAHPAMRRGTRTTLDVSEDLWVYQMTTSSGDPTPDTVYVAINRSDGDLTTSKLPAGLTELLTSTPEGSAPVTIPARQTRVFK